MKIYDKKLNRFYSLISAVDTNNEPRDYQKVLAVLKKIMTLQIPSINETYYDILYETMVEASNEFEIPVPFNDMNMFAYVYNALLEFGELSWIDVLEFSDDISRFRIPESVMNEMEKNFKNSYQDVLIAEAEKFSPFLEILVNKLCDSHFTLTTENPFYYKVFKEMFYDNKKVDIKVTNIYKYEFSSEKYDLILSVPKFGIRDKADEKSGFISREYDMIAAENLALHLKSEGVLSIVLPSKITFAGGNVKELREFLQSMYSLKQLSLFPSGIFDNTRIQTFLLTISTGRTDEVTINRYIFEDENALKTGNKNIVLKDTTFVLDDELEEMGDWNVERIFEYQDEDWKRFQESNIKKQELGTVATIFRGKAVNRKDPTGNIGVINISNIGEYEIDYSSLDYLEEEERKVEKYILEDGDLLIPARGTAIRVAIFEKQSYPCIASSNVIVIRSIDKSLSTTYLKIFFDSKLGRKMLITRQQGTTIMNISYKELNNLEIPLPSIEEQEQITETYTKELELYKKAIQEAENRWSSVLLELQERI